MVHPLRNRAMLNEATIIENPFYNYELFSSFDTSLQLLGPFVMASLNLDELRIGNIAGKRAPLPCL